MVKFWNEKRIYSVSEIAKILDEELSQAFADIFIEGEVSGVKKSPKGHIYFMIKDENASMKVMIYRNNVIRLGFEIDDGMLLILRGKVGLYEKNGDLQFYAFYAEPSGVGALQMRIEQAKRNLQKDGLTDPSRKRQIPLYPKTIGVVTSLEGAAIRDFVSILKRRNANIELIVAPSSVQGADAPLELKNSLRKLYKIKAIDLIVLTRGGGSIEDLMAFNEESLARMVAESPVPIISAVGHEIDTVLTDLTADLRASTPSAAAEILSEKFFSLKEEVERITQKIIEAMSNIIYLRKTKITIFDSEKIRKAIQRKIERAEERYDKIFVSMVESQKRRLSNYDKKINFLQKRISFESIYKNLLRTEEKIIHLLKEIFSEIKSKIKYIELNFGKTVQILSERNPMNILSKGYSIVKNNENKVIKRSSEINLGEILNVTLFEGQLITKVEEKKK